MTDEALRKAAREAKLAKQIASGIVGCNELDRGRIGMLCDVLGRIEAYAALSAPTPEPSEVTQEQVEAWGQQAIVYATGQAYLPDDPGGYKERWDEAYDFKLATLAYAAGRAAAGKEIHIVFDGPPSHESGRFVEVEDVSGKSIRAGRWEQRGDYWHLILDAAIDRAMSEKEPAK